MKLAIGAMAPVLVAIAITPGSAAGDTYVIQPDGLGHYPTIQAAIYGCTDGDIIELTDGTFTGDGNRDIMVPSRNITIRSQSGDPMSCIIDCEGSELSEHRGFYFEAAVGSGDATLQGVGIVNGYMTVDGGGVLIEGADTVMEDCIIANCTCYPPDGVTPVRGGGISVSSGGDPHLIDCLITGCTAKYGGGLAVHESGGTFERCTIGDNLGTYSSGGVYTQTAYGADFTGCSIVSNESPRVGGIRMQGSVTLTNCDVSRNAATYGDGGGIELCGGNDVINCTLAENSAMQKGGGVWCRYDGGTLTRCIIAYTENGCGVEASTVEDVPTMSCCDVYGSVEGDYGPVVGDQTGLNDNFSLPPEFCGRDAGDYRLFDTSPCLAASAPCGQLVGAFDQGCDSPVEKTSWGVIKAMWR